MLLTFEDAARQMGLPVASLRSAADRHGITIRMGRAVRIHPDDLGRLIDLCRVDPKAPACTGGQTDRPSKSETTTTGHRPAQAAALRLKARSRNTSRESTAQLVQLRRTK